MASAASARSARSALALAALAFLSGHVFSGTAAASAGASDIIRYYLQYLAVCFQMTCRNAAITCYYYDYYSWNFKAWHQFVAEIGWVATDSFSCDRSCLTGTFAATRQAAKRSGRLPRSAQTDPNFAANVGVPRPDSLFSRNMKECKQNQTNNPSISQRIPTSWSTVWMIWCDGAFAWELWMDGYAGGWRDEWMDG